MKNQYVALLALMLCVGAFLFPTTACASQGGNPPTVTATVEGEVLRIRASGGTLGVEAVFINENRFNFRVDGVLSVDLLTYSSSEKISVYAMDFEGNMSDVVIITNPHYKGMAVQQPTSPQSIPVTPSNAFTPTGQASVLDNANNHDEKEFFTFSTASGNVFFLVIDRQRGLDNVYFLNAVTERDLIALAEQAGTEIPVSSGGIPVSTIPQNLYEQSEIPQIEQPDLPPVDKGGGNGTKVFMLVAMAIAGVVGYYLKIHRPKQQCDDGDYDEDIGDEMEFENDSNITEDARDNDYLDTDKDDLEEENDGQ